MSCVLVLFMAIMAAALACAGYVSAIYLFSISVSVSKSSSASSTIVANGVVHVVLVVFPTCAVGVLVCPD